MNADNNEKVEQIEDLSDLEEAERIEKNISNFIVSGTTYWPYVAILS